VRVRPDALELGRRLSFWESAALLRLSFVYGVRPRWRHLAPLLVEASKRCTEVVGVA
jgi:hypothetical protein